MITTFGFKENIKQAALEGLSGWKCEVLFLVKLYEKSSSAARGKWYDRTFSFSSISAWTGKGVPMDFDVIYRKPKNWLAGFLYKVHLQ